MEWRLFSPVLFIQMQESLVKKDDQEAVMHSPCMAENRIITVNVNYPYPTIPLDNKRCKKQIFSVLS
ncbi:hypothetical protein [Bacillus sp. 1P06AnD]|uniref:hypothetical protein n=1 Tax=Bacillus sp. 1P06AnD TaxID=3132208 RepID=UPI0039A374A2